MRAGQAVLALWCCGIAERGRRRLLVFLASGLCRLTNLSNIEDATVSNASHLGRTWWNKGGQRLRVSSDGGLGIGEPQKKVAVAMVVRRTV